LAAAYFEALPKLHQMAYQQAAYPWDDYMAVSVSAALSAAKGRFSVGYSIQTLDLRD
jgi:hypothetical protein